MKQKTIKPAVHFTDNYLLNPTNAVMVTLIGCGGTGSQVLSGLARIHQSLLALNHAGLQVKVYDDDIVTDANLGRQLFARSEIGMNKASALVSRLNRFFGTNWKASPKRFDRDSKVTSSIIITCVDTAAARFDVAAILKKEAEKNNTHIGHPVYWLDFGNSQYTGQVMLSTVGEVKQPLSKKYQPVSSLPFVTDEYKELLEEAETDNTPSCSLAEALIRQDLFINSSLAQEGCSLLWQMFREGMVDKRGFFKNIRKFRTLPVPIVSYH